jgi:hypothetical protein
MRSIGPPITHRDGDLIRSRSTLDLPDCKELVEKRNDMYDQESNLGDMPQITPEAASSEQRHAAPASKPADQEMPYLNPTGTYRVGNLIIGAVDKVNGPSSRQASTEISVFEAKLIARHWIREILRYEIEVVILEQTSSTGRRISAYGNQRLDDLQVSGFITEGEIEQLFEEVRQEMKLPPFGEWTPIGPNSDEDLDHTESSKEPSPSPD